MPLCSQCLSPIQAIACTPCQSQSSLPLIPLEAEGYYLVHKDTPHPQIAIAFEAPPVEDWLKKGCLHGPINSWRLSHSKWNWMVLFEAQSSLYAQHQETRLSVIDLWQISKRILELLIRLKQDGFSHGALSLHTLHWQRPYLFFIGIRPEALNPQRERKDILAIANLLNTLNQGRQSPSFTSFIQRLSQHRTAKQALLDLHQCQMATLRSNRMPMDSDPLLHESIEAHLARARHRSWWTPRPQEDQIHPARLFVGMIITICAVVALLLSLLQYVRTL